MLFMNSNLQWLYVCLCNYLHICIFVDKLFFPFFYLYFVCKWHLFSLSTYLQSRSMIVYKYKYFIYFFVFVLFELFIVWRHNRLKEGVYNVQCKSYRWDSFSKCMILIGFAKINQKKKCHFKMAAKNVTVWFILSIHDIKIILFAPD